MTRERNNDLALPGTRENMINVSTDGSVVEKGSLYSKRSRGKVRLPPLSTKQLTGYMPQQEPRMQSTCERKASYSSSSNLSSPFTTENLITPTGDYKCPRSPSNLSLEFNFEEPRYAETAVPFEKKIEQVRPIKGKHGEIPVKSAILNRQHARSKSRTLNNEKSTTLAKKPSTGRKRQSNTITETTTVVPQANSLDDTEASARNRGTKSSTGTGLRVQTTNNKERKRSTYDLREFLSLPSGTEQKPNSMSIDPRNIATDAKPLQHSEKKPVKLAPKHKSSNDSTYDVFEFLAWSAESSRHLTSARKNRVKETLPQNMTKVKDIKSTKKPEIPSVIVADWSLSDDSPRTKQSIRHSRKLPKANFPSDDFPKKNEQRPNLATPKKCSQRNSVYDLKEFLLLPDATRRQSITKVSPQDIKPRSNSLEAESTREPDVKYDLGEFLNFLESGRSSLQVNATGRERSVGELQNRSLSVYNIYEFLKTSNPKELTADVEAASKSQSERSVIDVTSLVAKSSPKMNEENATQASCYNLREFLTLPHKVEGNQKESVNSRSANGQLKIN